MRATKLLIGAALLLAPLTLSPGVSAQESEPTLYKSVIITTTDGKVFGINLRHEMTCFLNENVDFEIHYPKKAEDGNFMFDDETGAMLYESVLSFPAYQLQTLDLNKEESGINAVPGIEFSVSYDVDTSTLTVDGAEGKEIAVVSADGRLELVTKGELATVIDMSRFGAGVHIVRIDTKTFKLLVK